MKKKIIKEEGEKATGKWVFLYEKGLFPKNCFKLQYFPHLVHSRKLCIVPRSKTLLPYVRRKNWGRCKWPRIWWSWRGNAIHDFKNSNSRLILFPSVQIGSQEFIQSDIEGAYTDEAIGSLRKYKAIHYLILKEHNKWCFPLLLWYWPTSLWELWVAHWKDAWLS